MKFKTSENKKEIGLSDSMIELLINQISHELYNHNLYKSFANYYMSEGLTPLHTYYTGRADEELLHHNWIVQYLNENHIAFNYPAVSEVTEEYDDLLTPFKLTLDKEIETTELIYKIVDLATTEKDWITLAWLNKDASGGPQLCLEQLEELSISRTALMIAEDEEDTWGAKATAILAEYRK